MQNDNWLIIEPVHGYNGPVFLSSNNTAVVREVTAVGALNSIIPLSLDTFQKGNLSQTFNDSSKVEMQFLDGSVSSKTTLSVSQTSASTKLLHKGAYFVGKKVYIISAQDPANSPAIGFVKSPKITFYLPQLGQASKNAGLYYYNNNARAWFSVSRTILDIPYSKIVFNPTWLNRMSQFAVIDAPGRPGVIRVETTGNAQESISSTGYRDGSLLRGSNRKIYIISGSTKKLIATMPALRKYANKTIFDVADSVLASYTTNGTIPANIGYVDQSANLSNGSLLRSPDGKIYLIENRQKIYIPSMAELEAFRGRKITNVTDTFLNSITSAPVFSEGNLVRQLDSKVYVIKNGVKVHIKSLSELFLYAGKKIYNIEF
ncbi:hypothetical protein HGA64_05605 [Candidatus Falkowbacteria bacterium]|nr:hypothetical protein [Candidatus Falkowbacteria bacterium]